MKYLYTKTEHYKKFLKENFNSNRISKSLKVLPEGDKINLFKISHDVLTEEIFQKPVETEYEIFNINNRFLKVLFKTKSKTEYRLDIHLIEEPFLGVVSHISFTENNKKYDIIPKNQEGFSQFELDYDKQLGKYEMIEVVSRINFILRSLLNSKKIAHNIFCIGGTELESKNNIYEYALKIIVGDSGFSKKKTDVYPKTGWGLYFSI